jgi:hypothetical protein
MHAQAFMQVAKIDARVMNNEGMLQRGNKHTTTLAKVKKVKER